MSDPAVDKTPEPVRWLTRVIAGLVLLLTQINPAAFYFGWWDISAAGLIYVGQLAGAVTAFLLFVWGEQVRDAVTPNSKVALTTTEAQVLAPLAPGGIPGNNAFQQNRFNEGADVGTAYGPVALLEAVTPVVPNWIPVDDAEAVPPPQASPTAAIRAPRQKRRGAR